MVPPMPPRTLPPRPTVPPVSPEEPPFPVSPPGSDLLAQRIASDAESIAPKTRSGVALTLVFVSEFRRDALISCLAK
jgi:hypothetical protein